MPMNADDYLANTEAALSRANQSELARASQWTAEAQVMALAAIAAAVDRLAAAVENHTASAT